MKAGKVWGETRTLVNHPLCAVEHLTIKAGSRCSMHKHAHKANWFYVVSGTLRIVVKKNDYDLTDVTVLGPGECCTVQPGEYHRFEAETDVVALEGYYPPVLSADIQRLDCGNAGAPDIGFGPDVHRRLDRLNELSDRRDSYGESDTPSGGVLGMP